MNGLYRLAGENFLKGQLSWTTNTIRMVLLNDQYVPNLESHKYLKDIPNQARIATSDSLANKLATDGYAKSDPAIFYTLFNLDKVVAVVIYKATGAETTSNLIAYADEATGLPFKATGKDYYILYDLIFGGYFRI